MRTFSNDFFDSLSGIRELNILVKYKDKNGTMLLTSEADENLLTEDGDFIGTETGNVFYNEETIINAFPKFNVNLFSTICKMVTIESLIRLEKGNKFNLRIGVKVGQDFEYMNYGDYVIIDEPTYNADTKTYTIVGYDRMIESSVLYDDDPLEITYPISHRGLLNAVCKKFNWILPKEEYTNQSKIIESDIYLGQKLTYRDVIDDLLKGTGDALYFDNNNVLNFKHIDFENAHTINDEFLKNVNVKVKEKYGPVNSLEVVTSDGSVLNSIKDTESIAEYGEYKLQLNSLLLQNYSNNYLTDLFNKVKGLEYYIYDFDTIGQLIYEPLDAIEITIGEDTYPSLVLNDEIKLTDGLEETMYAGRPKIAENDFIVITDEDKKINDAFIKIDKANGQIVLKATSDNKLVLAELNASPEEGSEFNVKADNINLEGYTTINGNFTIDDEGNMECNNATIKGDVYFPETDTEVINSSGILTSITFGSNGRYSGYDLLGIGTDMNTGNFVKGDAGIVYTIPNNFEVVSAFLTLNHTILRVGYGYNNSVDGNCTNIRLYKGNQGSAPIYNYYYQSEMTYMDTSAMGLTQINNWINGNSIYSASASAGSNQTLISSELKDKINITSGTTQVLVLRTDETPQNSGNFDNDCYVNGSKTGLVKLSLMLIGYTKFENTANRILLSVNPLNIENQEEEEEENE